MLKRIHVNQHLIRQKAEQPLTIKTYKENTRAREIQINGPCKVVYNPDKPLKCGARVWIETSAEIIAL